MTTPSRHARREARRIAAQATRTHSAAARHDRARQRTGKPPGAVDKAVQAALENPPTVATALAGLVTTLVGWGVAELPPSVPMPVAAALLTLGIAVAGIIGKMAQRFTYDRAGMDESVANFVDDLHAVAGTEPDAIPPHGP